jgi:hypothetical protein
MTRKPRKSLEPLWRLVQQFETLELRYANYEAASGGSYRSLYQGQKLAYAWAKHKLARALARIEKRKRKVKR